MEKQSDVLLFFLISYKRKPDVKPTTHLELVPSARIMGFIRPLSYAPSLHGNDLKS
jgi:hypothetical protein